MREMNVKRFAILILIITVAIVFFVVRYCTRSDMSGVIASAGKGDKPGKDIPAEIFVAGFESLQEGIRSVGTLLPNEEVDISSEIAGKVVQINFEEGSFVKKGSLLVKVDDRDLQAQLKRAEFQRDLLKERLERQRILLDKDAVSREAFDQVQTDYQMVEADIELLRVKIDRTEIRAPFDGVIGFRSVSLGSYIQPSTLIARLVDRSSLKVEFSVPEKYIFANLNGKPVTFTTEGGTETYRACIYAVDSKSDPKTHTITLRAFYPNEGMRLMPGMFARVTIGADMRQRALMIPTEAIIPQMEGKSIWLLRNGKAEPVPVETGVRTERMIEVTEGIVAGDSVIVTGLMQLRQGAPVSVSSVRKSL